MLETTVKKGSGNMQITTYDGQRPVSWGGVSSAEVNLNGTVLPAARLGGVGTEPEYRRLGLVRKYFAEAWNYINEENIPVSFLHPFSFAYYRKMGYERVSDHRILEFPMSALDFVPRYADLVRCVAPQRAEDIAEVYNRFAEGRNIMFRRTPETAYMGAGNPDAEVYLLYGENGKAEGYMVLAREQYYYVNRMASVNLHVRELCFTSPEALLKLLGFLRMYEGQMDSIKVHNCAMSPELETTLRHYTHTKITVIPDIMARIHDVEAVLKAVKYPDTPGCFTVRVREPAGTGHDPAKTDGCWRVAYGKGTASVERLDPDALCDLDCDICAFTRLVFGFDSIGVETARYLPGTKVNTSCEDFFRAFPNRPCGLFEHF